MTMSIIAVLVSLAMMLTGAGTAGMPADVARTLTIHDVTLTFNDETVTLDPAVRLGAATDGESALFDFAVDANGEALFPVQLKANADGLTALFATSGQAVNVPAETLDGLMAQLQQMMSAQMGSDPQTAQVLTFLKDEFVPAYVGLFDLAQDDVRTAELQEKAKALFAEKIDRGEGAPDTVEIDGEAHDVTLYHYTIDSAQLFGFTDALYTLDPALQNYYDALIKLYSMMPEDSGLNGITSLSDAMERIGMDMQMEIDEALNEAEQIDIMDAVMTFNIPVPAAAADSEDGEGGEVPQPEPVVVNLHASQYGELSASNFDMDYSLEGVRLVMNGYAEQTDTAYEMNMSMKAEENGEEMANMTMQASRQPDADTADVKSDATMTITAKGATVIFTAEGTSAEDGAESVNLNLVATAGENGNASMSATVDKQADGSEDATVALSVSAGSGVDGSVLVTAETAADGTGEGQVTLAVAQGENAASLSFDVTVSGDAIADASEGAEVTVIDDLSQESLQALGADQGFQGKMMQVMGSFMADAQKLMGDESVAKLAGLFSAFGQGAVQEVQSDEDIDAGDEEYEIDLSDAEVDEDGNYVISMDDVEFEDGDYDLDFEEDVEDDGVLPFNEPAFTWLPEGWEVVDSNVDTAYDMTDVSVYNEATGDSLYAVFYANPDEAQPYVVGEDGAIAPVEGRVVNLSRSDEIGWTVNLEENGVFASLYIYSDAITMDDVGQILAGLTF